MKHSKLSGKEKINKIELGAPYQHYGMIKEEYSIEKRLEEFESHHSTIKEYALVEILEEIQNKLNELIETVNAQQKQIDLLMDQTNIKVTPSHGKNK